MFVSFFFAQNRTQRACRLFLNYLKGRGGLTRSELSKFAWNLEAGKIEKSFTYRRTSFYRQVRRVLLTLGLVAIEQRFDAESNDVKEKYVPVRQPIPKRPPDGLNLVRLTWIICKRWNDEFLE